MSKKIISLFLLLMVLISVSPKNVFAKNFSLSNRTAIDVFKEIEDYQNLKPGEMSAEINKIVNNNLQILQMEDSLSKLNANEITDLIILRIEDYKDIQFARAFATSSDYAITNHWWGVSHKFYSKAAANRFAHEVVTAANLNAGAAVLAGALLGGFGGVPNGLTAAYCYQLAEDVRDNAYYLNRFALDIAFTLNYKMYKI